MILTNFNSNFFIDSEYRSFAWDATFSTHHHQCSVFLRLLFVFSMLWWLFGDTSNTSQRAIILDFIDDRILILCQFWIICLNYLNYISIYHAIRIRIKDHINTRFKWLYCVLWIQFNYCFWIIKATRYAPLPHYSIIIPS